MGIREECRVSVGGCMRECSVGVHVRGERSVGV